MSRNRRYGLFGLMVLVVTGCALETPYLDSHFGQSSEQAQTTQAVSGNRAPTNGRMSAQALHNGMSNYMGDRPAPQAIQGVINNSMGGSTGQ